MGGVVVSVMESPVLAALGRPVRALSPSEPLDRLRGERVWVTGAAGSIGQALDRMLVEADVDVTVSDLGCDVRDSVLARVFALTEPTVVFHLAGAKHAPAGEEDPWATAETNIVGTRNVLAAAPGARVVLASTCKACDPETAYGASKLIAERMVLNAGGSVARFYNVVESAGNVFELWGGLPLGAPVPVTGCERFFLALEEAVALLLWAAVLPSGRYTVDPGRRRYMPSVAADLFPGRLREMRAPRRGDRLDEPRCASSETIVPVAEVPGLERIVGSHDS